VYPYCDTIPGHSIWQMYFMFTGTCDCRADWKWKDTGNPFEDGMEVVNNISKTRRKSYMKYIISDAFLVT
jgi:hypothetical protein